MVSYSLECVDGVGLVLFRVSHYIVPFFVFIVHEDGVIEGVLEFEVSHLVDYIII